MSQDIVSDGLNQIMNAKKSKKSEIVLSYYSKLLISVLALGKLKGYIKDYHFDKGNLKIEIGNLNECQAIKPRFTVQVSQLERYEKRFLLTKGFGILIISTPKGLITNDTAKEKNIGGSLIAYMY